MVDGSLWPALISAAMLGLLGGGHCVGMCGGIVAALSFAGPEGRTPMVTTCTYHLGRILGYTLIAMLVALPLGLGVDEGQGARWLRFASGALMIAMGLYLAGWWMGLSMLERVGGYLWRYLQPLGRHLLPIRHPLQAIAAGLLWAWLPCGLVYSALVLAVTRADVFEAAAVMLAFGLGTLPLMLGLGFAAGRLKSFLQARRTRIISAIFIVLFGVWTVLGASGLLHDHASMQGGHSHHHHH